MLQALCAKHVQMIVVFARSLIRFFKKVKPNAKYKDKWLPAKKRSLIAPNAGTSFD